jgi:hypothetical protein
MSNKIEMLELVGSFAEADLDVKVKHYDKSFNDIRWINAQEARVVFVEARLEGHDIKMSLRMAESAVAQCIG